MSEASKNNPALQWIQHKRLVWFLIGIVLVLITVVAILLYSIFNRGIRVVGMDPSGEINTKTNITFAFSSDVVEQNVVGTTTREKLVKFTPKASGKFRWVSRRELRFLPEVPLLPSTGYTAEVQGSIVRVRDRFLSGNRRIKFATEHFRVENCSLNFGSLGEQRKGQVLQAHLSFNYPVAPAELQKALDLQFKNSRRQINYNLDQTENSTSFTVISDPLFLKDSERKIRLNISKGLCCVNGRRGLLQDKTVEVVLGAKKDLTIIEAAPKNGGAQCWIAVHCSEMADAKLMADFIRIKPGFPYQAEADGDYVLIKSDHFKPGKSINLHLTAGFPAVNGHPLKRDFSATVTFTDLEPSLKFNTPGRYLSSKGNLNLGLETVNVERVNLEVSRIYANNIVNYLNSLDYEDYLSSDSVGHLGKVVRSDVLQLHASKNELVTTPINLRDYLSKFRGILQVVVYDDDERWRQDAKYVIVTDLGIVGKMAANELTVWVNSLESLKPKVKTKVSLISKNNQVLAAEFTDKQGIARFKGIKKLTADFEPFLILAEAGHDFSFVHFANSQISTTDFDIRGRRHLAQGYEAYLYLDRNIFRPGDQGNLVALVRGQNAAMPPEFPVKLEISQPDGQIFKELQSNTGNRGAAEFRVEIPEYAPTGKYQAKLLVAAESIGTTNFSVEEFLPERIKVSTRTDKNRYRGGETAQIGVKGINLFGPPAAGRRVDLKVTLEPALFKPQGYSSFVFGDPDQPFNVKEEELGEGQLDAAGNSTYTYTFPEGLTPPAKLRAVFQGTVIEDGGRAVSSFKAVDFHPYRKYIGIQRLSEYYCQIDRPFEIKYVVVNESGKSVDFSEINAEVIHVTWNSIYRRNSEGRYEYVSEEEHKPVWKKTITTSGKGEHLLSYVPHEYGEYQLILRDADGQSKAAVKFYASGWGYSAWAMDKADQIQVETGKKQYRVGEQAEIQIKAPFSGKALVTVEREKIYDLRIIELKQNSGLIKIPVKEEYQPNVYVSVHLIRSIKSLEKRAPVRAFGTVPLRVDCSNHRLQVNLDVSKQLRPHHDVNVKVKVNKGFTNTYITLAAVDEGICQLTDFQAPNPSGFFYGKRSLNIENYDLYGMILPEVENAKIKSAVAGDADTEGVRKQNLNPVSVKRVKPVSLWSGLVKPDATGTARIKLKLPQFNGTLRLMAVAASDNNFGSAEQKVIVRDPIVITPTFPRFVAGKDHFQVPVSIANGTGRAGEFQIHLKAEGQVEILNNALQIVHLNKGAEQQIVYELQAKNSAGKLAFRIQARGNGETCVVEENLPLRPPVALTHDFKCGSITKRQPLTINLRQKYLPGTASYQLTLAPFPTLKLAGGLQYLLGYPHGCIEQTTSKLFPLLYFDNLAQVAQNGVFTGGDANYYITQGILKIESMQLRDGSFTYWPGGDCSNEWCSIYASHFLVEARKAGFAVSDRIYTRMMRYLETVARISDNSEYRLQNRVYALYVLSLAGKPQLSSMSYLKNLYLAKLWDYSRAQLAAAYFYSGERATARKLLPRAFTTVPVRRESGDNFNSPVRSEAIILNALADVDPTNKSLYKLVSHLSKQAAAGSWKTTQENAFALLALGKVYAKKSEGTYQGEVWAGGKRLAMFNNQKPLKLTDRSLGQGSLEIKITGNGECYYFIQSSGVSLDADQLESEYGISVRRGLLDRHGKTIDPGQIRQGDLLVVHLTIDALQDDLANVAIVDLLPGGLEIENPRLSGSAKLAWLNSKAIEGDYLDIRDDRIIIFKSFETRGVYHFYYAVRAVTCGDFVLPAVKGECMYDPEIHSIHSAGHISIHR